MFNQRTNLQYLSLMLTLTFKNEYIRTHEDYVCVDLDSRLHLGTHPVSVDVGGINTNREKDQAQEVGQSVVTRQCIVQAELVSEEVQSYKIEYCSEARSMYVFTQI